MLDAETQIVIDTVMNGQRFLDPKPDARPGSARTGFGLRVVSTRCWGSSPGLQRQSGDALLFGSYGRVGRQWLMLERAFVPEMCT